VLEARNPSLKMQVRILVSDKDMLSKKVTGWWPAYLLKIAERNTDEEGDGLPNPTGTSRHIDDFWFMCALFFSNLA
jgi:hypothetical protein